MTEAGIRRSHLEIESSSFFKIAKKSAFFKLEKNLNEKKTSRNQKQQKLQLPGDAKSHSGVCPWAQGLRKV